MASSQPGSKVLSCGQGSARGAGMPSIPSGGGRMTSKGMQMQDIQDDAQSSKRQVTMQTYRSYLSYLVACRHEDMQSHASMCSKQAEQAFRQGCITTVGLSRGLMVDDG